MTTDITPEAVEHLCAIHDGYGQHGTVATLHALSAALTDYQKGQTYRYLGKNGLPILARDLEDQRDAAIAALTASQAETAAAYEVAARICDREWEAEQHSIATRMWPIRANADWIADEIRCILTPGDSKAALDRMIAEAEERGMRRAADIVIPLTPDITDDMLQGRRDVRNAILAAIPKGGAK